MKKLLVLVLALCLVMGTVAMATASAEKMGIGVYTPVSKADNAYELDGDLYDGAVNADSTVCCVVLDDNGVIKAIRFDVTQFKVTVKADGSVAGVVAGDRIISKNEKKEAYGMVAYANAPAGEWYVQAAAFEQYCIGKTVEEVLGLELGEDGKLVDADIKATCSIIVSDWLKALEIAAADAR
ncbi:MAG: hypothetical protein IJ968_02745 [Clostridia bacterium]|nr:hypothetical protein [Clostridia bacterium]